MPISQRSPSGHPGLYIRQQVLPASLSVTAAAKALGVGRPALSNLLNGNASLSPEMATRIEKAFGASSDALLKMQADYDRSLARDKEPAIAVRSYAPNFMSIKAMQIEAWAERQEARAELVAFLRRLVISTGIELSKTDFPAYENSQRKGWDGAVTAGSATPWVPLGASGWEFGVNQDAARKAEEDYTARTKGIASQDRADTTHLRLCDAAQLAGQRGVGKRQKSDRGLEGRSRLRRERPRTMAGGLDTGASLDGRETGERRGGSPNPRRVLEAVGRRDEP